MFLSFLINVFSSLLILSLSICRIIPSTISSKLLMPYIIVWNKINKCWYDFWFVMLKGCIWIDCINSHSLLAQYSLSSWFFHNIVFCNFPVSIEKINDPFGWHSIPSFFHFHSIFGLSVQQPKVAQSVDVCIFHMWQCKVFDVYHITFVSWSPQRDNLSKTFLEYTNIESCKLNFCISNLRSTILTILILSLLKICDKTIIINNKWWIFLFEFDLFCNPLLDMQHCITLQKCMVVLIHNFLCNFKIIFHCWLVCRI